MRTIQPCLVLLVASLSVAFLCGIEGADPAELRAWTASVVTVESASGPPRRLGSGVIVSEAGHVATAFSVVSGAGRLRVRGHNGKAWSVVGVAAADPERELVLLATKGITRRAAVATPVDRSVAVGEPVHAIGGPGSAPWIVASDQIDRIESGERSTRSLPGQNAAPSSALIAPDQCRIVHHAYLTTASLGGGLFADDGSLLGILVANADWPDRVHVAVHAGHLRELLDTAGPPRSLATLERAGDTPSMRAPDEIARLREARRLPPAECDALRRAAVVRERLQALRKTLAELPEEERRILVRAGRWKGEERLPQEHAERVRQAIAANRLAIASIEPEVEIVGAERPTQGSDPPTLGQPERAFSPRQRLLGQQLEGEHQSLLFALAMLDAERLRLESRHAQTSADIAALGRIGAALVRTAFFAGDPLGMRGDEELEDALPELDAEIAEGRPAGVFLLLRGLWLTRLERWDEARADFDRLIEDDRALRPAARLARARAEGRRTGKSVPEAVIQGARAGRGDPITETILARVAIDAGDWSEAAGWLRAARDHGGDTAEIDLALACLTLSREGPERNPRRAADHARGACRASLGTDWRAWGLVALAAAAEGRWSDAEAMLDESAELATGFAPDTLRHWRRCVQDRRLPEQWFAR